MWGLERVNVQSYRETISHRPWAQESKIYVEFGKGRCTTTLETVFHLPLAQERKIYMFNTINLQKKKMNLHVQLHILRHCPNILPKIFLAI